MSFQLPKGRGGLSEDAFQGQVVQLAQLLRWRVAHFRPARTDKGWRTPVQGDGTGFPDLILVRPPRLVAAELKMPGERPTPAQEAWLADLAAAGAECFVWTPTHWSEIERVLQGVR